LGRSFAVITAAVRRAPPAFFAARRQDTATLRVGGNVNRIVFVNRISGIIDR